MHMQGEGKVHTDVESNLVRDPRPNWDLQPVSALAMLECGT